MHGVSGESSSREEIIEGVEYYKDVLLQYPRIHINHINNLDNIHWGAQRLRFYRRYGFLKINAPATYGHDKGSIYFWGDLCKKYIKYVRGKCFDDINTLKLDPYMPFYEKRFPYVNAWFSCSNGANLELTNNILSQANQERLAQEKGLCILYTHFGTKGFVDEKYKINHQLQKNLTALSEKNGWFAPAGEILDFLSQKEIKRLSPFQDLRILFNILKFTIKKKILH